MRRRVVVDARIGNRHLGRTRRIDAAAVSGSAGAAAERLVHLTGLAQVDVVDIQRSRADRDAATRTCRLIVRHVAGLVTHAAQRHRSTERQDAATFSHCAGGSIAADSRRTGIGSDDQGSAIVEDAATAVAFCFVVADAGRFDRHCRIGVVPQAAALLGGCVAGNEGIENVQRRGTADMDTTAIAGIGSACETGGIVVANVRAGCLNTAVDNFDAATCPICCVVVDLRVARDR